MLKNKSLTVHYSGTPEMILQTYLEELRSCRKLLDYGSGTGNFLRLCKESMINAEGYDPNPAAAEICRRDGLVCHSERPDLAEYDGLLMVCVIEHMKQDDLWEVLASFAGTIVIHSDEPRQIWTPFNTNMPSFWDDFEHVRPYTPRALESMLKHFGYTVIKQGRVKWPRSVWHLRTWLTAKVLDLIYYVSGVGGPHFIVGKREV